MSQGVKLLPEEGTIQLKEKHPNMTDFLGKPLTSFFLHFSFLFHVFSSMLVGTKIQTDVSLEQNISL